MINRLLKLHFKKPDRGDTILEVLLTIAILALALGGGYALSNRSFHTSLHTHERVQALTLAQGQIEFLKNKNPSEIASLAGTYQSGSFCFNDTNGAHAAANTPTCEDKQGLYNLAISYTCASGCNQANTFTIQATWEGFGTGRQNNLWLYYKPQI